MVLLAVELQTNLSPSLISFAGPRWFDWTKSETSVGRGGGGRGHKCNKTNNDDRYPRILEHDSSENPVINTNIIVEAKISENKIACCCIVVLRPR